jgi:predicted methyltransferase
MNKWNVTASEVVSDKFYFTAILEYLPESMTYFKQVVGVKASNVTRHEHRSRKQPLSAKGRALIVERNQLDIMLYEKVKADLLSRTISNTS